MLINSQSMMVGIANDEIVSGLMGEYREKVGEIREK
jgi:hypothetical protein